MERNYEYLFDENGKIPKNISELIKGIVPRYSIYSSDINTIKSDVMSFEGEYTSADEDADKAILNKYIRRVTGNYLKYINISSDKDETYEKMAQFIYENSGNRIGNIAGGNIVNIGKIFFGSDRSSNNFISDMESIFAMLQKKFDGNDTKSKKEERTADKKKFTVTKFIQLFLLYLIHGFCRLKKSTRQYIYCYDIATEIENQFKIGTDCIKVERNVYDRSNGREEIKTSYFRHYALREDDEVNSYYLVGYSKSADNDMNAGNGKVGIYSVKLNNIVRVVPDSGNCFPDDPKKYSDMNVEERIQQNGAAFANRVPTNKSWIYLTARGYNNLYLKSVLHLRPIPYEEPELLTGDDIFVINGESYVYRLTFECSPRQLYNYFFSMGADVFVPQKFLRNGAEQYNNKETYRLFFSVVNSLYKMYHADPSHKD